MGKAKAPEMTPEQRRYAKQVAGWLQFEVRRRELTQGEAARRVGVRDSVARDRLGHAGATISAHYDRALPAEQAEAADRIGRLLDGEEATG